jgi:antibiotic biosynthesis monooxygenase (ABM) superfamily enzyme
LLLFSRINTEGLVMEGKYIALEFESRCKVAVIIDLTYFIVIQKFNFCVLHHLNRYKFNLQFQIVVANFLNCTIAQYATE